MNAFDVSPARDRPRSWLARDFSSASDSLPNCCSKCRMRGTRRAARASRRVAGPPTRARISFWTIGPSLPEYGGLGGQDGRSTYSSRRSATAASLTVSASAVGGSRMQWGIVPAPRAVVLPLSETENGRKFSARRLHELAVVVADSGLPGPEDDVSDQVVVENLPAGLAVDRPHGLKTITVVTDGRLLGDLVIPRRQAG